MKATIPGLFALEALAQTPQRLSTRPPENNDSTLRPITAEEVPPNLNFYAIDPLYRPGSPLGWATTRIEEKLDRGMLAMPLDAGKVYLGWRLLKSDPAGVAFNVYRITGSGRAVKLNAQPLSKTSDFLDSTAPRDSANFWFVRPVINGREQPESERATLAASAPAAGYRSIQLNNVQTADRIGIGDLNGDGTYDYVVKHPTGRVDPGRSQPSRDSYKIDAHDGRTGAFLWRIDLGWNVNHGIWFSPDGGP